MSAAIHIHSTVWINGACDIRIAITLSNYMVIFCPFVAWAGGGPAPPLSPQTKRYMSLFHHRSISKKVLLRRYRSFPALASRCQGVRDSRCMVENLTGTPSNAGDGGGSCTSIPRPRRSTQNSRSSEPGCSQRGDVTGRTLRPSRYPRRCHSAHGTASRGITWTRV